MKRRIEYIQVLLAPLRLKLPSRGRPARFSRVEAPSQQAFEELVIDLADLTNSIGPDTDQLEISIDALHSVIEYLQGSGEIGLSDILQPLINILSAAEDTLNGAKSPLLQQRPISKGGRPTDLTMHRTRALIVAALDTLAQAGISLDDAANHVTQELKKLGLINPLTNHDYTASELLELRKKIRDATGPQKSVAHHRALNSKEAEPLRAMAALQGDPKMTAWNLLKAAALRTPTSPDAWVVNADTPPEQPPEPT